MALAKHLGSNHWQSMGRTFAADIFCTETLDIVNCNTCNFITTSVELSWENPWKNINFRVLNEALLFVLFKMGFVL